MKNESKNKPEESALFNKWEDVPPEVHALFMRIANTTAGVISSELIKERNKVPAFYLARFPDMFNAITDAIKQSCALLGVNYARIGSLYTMMGFTAAARTVLEDRSARYGLDLRDVRIEGNRDSSADEVIETIGKAMDNPPPEPAPRQGNN